MPNPAIMVKTAPTAVAADILPARYRPRVFAGITSLTHEFQEHPAMDPAPKNRSIKPRKTGGFTNAERQEGQDGHDDKHEPRKDCEQHRKQFSKPDLFGEQDRRNLQHLGHRSKTGQQAYDEVVRTHGECHAG